MSVRFSSFAPKNNGSKIIGSEKNVGWKINTDLLNEWNKTENFRHRKVFFFVQTTILVLRWAWAMIKNFGSLAFLEPTTLNFHLKFMPGKTAWWSFEIFFQIKADLILSKIVSHEFLLPVRKGAKNQAICPFFCNFCLLATLVSLQICRPRMNLISVVAQFWRIKFKKLKT